jgi:hypothetical protein
MSDPLDAMVNAAGQVADDVVGVVTNTAEGVAEDAANAVTTAGRAVAGATGGAVDFGAHAGGGHVGVDAELFGHGVTARANAGRASVGTMPARREVMTRTSAVAQLRRRRSRHRWTTRSVPA